MSLRPVTSVKTTAFTLCVFLFLGMGFSLSAQDPPAEVLEAARQGLHGENLVLGFGFQVYTVNPAQLVDKPGEPLHALLIPAGMWRFVVLSEGLPQALITVDKVDGQWSAVSIGGTGLAKEITALRNQWPKNKGYDFRFLRIYQAKADLMEIREKSLPIGFAALESGRIALGISGQALVYNSEIFETLREKVARVITVEKLSHQDIEKEQ